MALAAVQERSGPGPGSSHKLQLEVKCRFTAEFSLSLYADLAICIAVQSHKQRSRQSLVIIRKLVKHILKVFCAALRVCDR